MLIFYYSFVRAHNTVSVSHLSGVMLGLGTIPGNTPAKLEVRIFVHFGAIISI